MELKRQISNHANLAAEFQVLSFAYLADEPREVIARVSLGDATAPLSGVGGPYHLNFYINGTLITPVSSVVVPENIARTIAISRTIPIEAGDLVTITVDGQDTDTDVTVVASLRDATPLRKEEMIGSGPVEVGYFRIVNNVASPIQNAVVRCYLATDYAAGNRGPGFIKGETTTDVNGRIRSAFMLDPASYTLVAYKQGEYQPKVVPFIVAIGGPYPDIDVVLVGIAKETAGTACLVDCVEGRTARARITQIYDEDVRQRMRSVRAAAAGAITIEWTMISNDGVPVDLGTCLIEDGSLTCKLRVIDATYQADPEYDGTIADAATGMVRAVVDTRALGPGIYRAEFGVFDGIGVLAFTNTFYLIVEASLFAGFELSGPPTIAEVRLHLRDSSPQESRLLDENMWDDAEIALALTKPVQYWNEAPPPIGTHTTQSFPYRFHWIEGVTGLLFKQAAEGMRRNAFGYQAGGIQVEDSNKWQAYEQLGDQHWQTFINFVRAKKVEINIAMCWGTVTSPYSWY